MFRYLATSSSPSLSQTCAKVQNAFAFITVSGQLIHFHLAIISKEFLIHLDHLRISRSPAKEILGVHLPTRLSERLLVPLGGGGMSGSVREPASRTEHLVSVYWGGVVFPLAQPGPGLTFAYLDYCQSGGRICPRSFHSRKGSSPLAFIYTLGLMEFSGSAAPWGADLLSSISHWSGRYCP